MRSTPTGTLGILGGMLIMASGVLSTLLGWRNDLLLYEPDPGGRFGHVGMVTGLGAVAIGIAIIVLATRRCRSRRDEMLSAVFMMVLGHAGAVTGALIVGTAGMVLCYVAGIWRIIRSRYGT